MFSNKTWERPPETHDFNDSFHVSVIIHITLRGAFCNHYTTETQVQAGIYNGQ